MPSTGTFVSSQTQCDSPSSRTRVEEGREPGDEVGVGEHVPDGVDVGGHRRRGTVRRRERGHPATLTAAAVRA